MKKVYTKPEVVFESFSMSTSIAGDCEKIIGNAVRGTCGIEYGPLVIFVDAQTGCSTNIVASGYESDGDDAKYDGYCYHVPSNNLNYFNS